MKILLSSVCLENGTDIQLALYYLKSYLLKVAPSSAVTIRVFNEKRNIPAIVKEALALKPGLIGFSCYIWNIRKILDICRRLKNIDPRLKIVLGGPEVSPRAEEILAKEEAVDMVVRGEGEESFARLIHMGPSRVKGVSFRKGKKIIHNPDRPLLRDINKIPSPYLGGLFDLQDKSIVDIPLETTRGCAFRCGYCYYHKNLPTVRYFSLSRVEKELQLILSNEPREVYLMDATFNANPERAKEILRVFIRHNRRSNLHVELKAELVDSEMAYLLSEANANNIEIGIQSTDPKALRVVNRDFNKERFKKGIRALNKQGLYYEIQLIDLLPYQDYKSLMRSLDWLYSLHPAKVVIFRLAVLPGTALRERAGDFGIEYGRQPPYYAYKSNSMDRNETKKVERLFYAMDRLYDSRVFQKTLYAFKRKTGVKISAILEDWVEWEARFTRHPEDYPEFLNRKSPVFLQYLCRKHRKPYLYKELLPGLLKTLPPMFYHK
ncbi:MAG: radical SAM protein [Candidatus Omnitrophota bacterium]|jgi:radical SAM superfamily enzyme YgiQ (UPF0313 family)